MMNYLNVPDSCEVKFTYDNFVIKKVCLHCLPYLQGESLVIQPTDEIFASYSSLVELKVFSFLGGSYIQAIRTALSSYTTLTNNSRITLNLDGQKFSIIIRLLSPDDKVRTTDKMQILVSNQIYVGIACMM